jgi:DNA-binding CsgD family transcriptional regulator
VTVYGLNPWNAMRRLGSHHRAAEAAARRQRLARNRMAPKPKIGMWSMKTDRELIQLAKSRTLEDIADYLQRSPAYIPKRAARLGLSVKRKAKGK